MTDVAEKPLKPDDLRLFLRTIEMATPEQIKTLGAEAADHIDAQDATIKALVEALGKLERICKNGQPDKISDGVKIASDAIALSNIPRDA